VNTINSTTSSTGVSTSTINTDGTDLPSTMTTATTVGSVNVSAQGATVIAAFQALIDGIDSELTDLKSLVINKQTVTKAQLLSSFQGRLTAAQSTKSARLAYHAAVAAEAQVAKQVAPERAGVKLYLVQRYGKSSPELQTFGFTPAKVPQKTAASKANAAVKAKATRKALGTKGKKQKKAALANLAASASSAAAVQPAASSVAPSAAVATTAPVAPAAAAPAAVTPSTQQQQ
jgi:hypothetical protein